jgi:hypothetical protein
VANAPASCIGDGAYDRAYVLDAVRAKNPASSFAGQRSRAVINRDDRSDPAGSIRSLNEHGRMNYHRRSKGKRRSAA